MHKMLVTPNIAIGTTAATSLERHDPVIKEYAHVPKTAFILPASVLYASVSVVSWITSRSTRCPTMGTKLQPMAVVAAMFWNTVK